MKPSFWLRLGAAIAFVCSLASACAQYTTVTSAHLGGIPAASGTVYWQPITGIAGAPAAARVGTAGGQIVTPPYHAAVASGVSSLAVPDALVATPNICYAVTAIDSYGNTILGNGIQPDGIHVAPGGAYGCVQPTGSSWDFDTYIPVSAVFSGSASVGTVTPLASSASPWATLSGYGPYLLNLGIPAGATGPTGPPGGSLSYPGVTSDGAYGVDIVGEVAAGATAINISTSAQLSAALAVCGSATCALTIGGNITISSNLSIPANVNLTFSGGQLQPGTGATVTILGKITDTTSQIFGGAGSITGLTLVRPEWFGAAATVCTSINALATNGGDVYLQNATYRGGCEKNNPADYNSMGWMVTPNVHLHGAARPTYNSGYTQMVGGTIIQGGFYVRANGFHVDHVGFDAGSVVQALYYPTYTSLESLQVTGALPYDATHYPYLTGIVVDDVNCLGKSSTSPDHCIIVEDVDGAYVHNVQTAYHTHGLVLKGIGSVLDDVYARGNASNGIIIKSDTYAPGQADSLSHAVVASLVSDGDGGGVRIQAASSSLFGVNLSDIQVSDTTFGLTLEAESSLSAVEISNFQYNGFSVVGPCVTTSGSSTIANIPISNLFCTASSGVSTPTAINGLQVANGYVGATTGDAFALTQDTAMTNVYINVASGHAINMLSGTASVSNLKLYGIVGSQFSGVVHLDTTASPVFSGTATADDLALTGCGSGTYAKADGTGCGTPSSGGSGTVNSGTSGQIAYYSAGGTAVGGTGALPSGTTATTQSATDNTTKLATTAQVQAAIAAATVTSSTLPATCTAGQVWTNPSPTTALNIVYECHATNTWIPLQPSMPGNPTLVLDSGTATISLVTGSNDGSGWINGNWSVAPTASAGLITLDFGTTEPATPKCSATPANAATSALAAGTAPFVNQADGTTGRFVLRSNGTAIATGTAYQWGYSCKL